MSVLNNLAPDAPDHVSCPVCGSDAPLDSVRVHVNGRKRTYWECGDCNVSIMKRNGD